MQNTSNLQVIVFFQWNTVFVLKTDSAGPF